MGLYLESLFEKARMTTIGLIVNPIAGMGGTVALKGTDGVAVLREARRLGARPRAQERTAAALEALIPFRRRIRLVTGAGSMGEDVARALDFEPDVLPVPAGGETCARDTIEAAIKIRDNGASLLLFAGGDGTARDVYTAVGDTLPVVGIPAGVKIHSAVFAQNPRLAGELAVLMVEGKVRRYLDAEVVDIDEDDYRREILSARLYGYLKIPLKSGFTQRLKAGSQQNEHYLQTVVAESVMGGMADRTLYVLGAGTTIRAIMERLGLAGSLLGIDVVLDRSILARDATEERLLEILDGNRLPIQLVVTPIGGQGYIFGRGNQQLSPVVLRRIGKNNIMIVSTPGKLAALAGRPLLVDTGDRALDRDLSGYYRVVTGVRQSSMYRVSG